MQYCAHRFFKGALLEDTQSFRLKPEEKTQAGRLIRFTNVQDVLDMEPILKVYIKEAIELEKAGLKVEFMENSDIIYPEELRAKNKFTKPSH